jgi:major type 1 subunit fimbrin (pilin)
MNMRWFELLVRKAGLRRWLGVIAGMILLVLSGPTWATPPTCTGGGQTYTLAMPASVSVPRDAAVGTLLSGWVSTPAITNFYTCQNATGGPGSYFEPLSLTKSGLTITSTGVTYTVFNTNVPGIGIAISVAVYFSGCGGWMAPEDLGGIGAAVTPTLSGWVGYTCNADGTFGGQLSAILVKTGPTTGGTISGGIIAEAWSDISPDPYVSFSLSPTAFVATSCSTPDVTVSMGSYRVSTFTGKGSSSTPVGFNVAVNNCPAGMNSIQYQFASASGVVNASQGVIALASSSTATGIGLQLKSSSPSVVLSYNQQYQLSSYNAATGGSYNIPLTAAYYQTGKTVTPGTANAIVTFTMTYQ